MHNGHVPEKRVGLKIFVTVKPEIAPWWILTSAEQTEVPYQAFSYHRQDPLNTIFYFDIDIP